MAWITNGKSRITDLKISFPWIAEIRHSLLNITCCKRVWRKKNRERLSQDMSKSLSIDDANHLEDPHLKLRRIEWQVKSRKSVNDSSSSRGHAKPSCHVSRRRIITENQPNSWSLRNQNPIRLDQELPRRFFSRHCHPFSQVLQGAFLSLQPLRTILEQLGSLGIAVRGEIRFY